MKLRSKAKLIPIIYTALFLIAAIGGRNSVYPKATADTNVNWILVSILFFLFWGFCPLAAWRGLSSSDWIERAFWKRTVKWGYGMWKNDAMQCIWFARTAMLAVAVGAAVGLPHADEKGVMRFVADVAMAAGLLLGERTCYWIWKDKIAESDAWEAEHP